MGLAPACQESSHVGNVKSLKGAPLALPSFATALGWLGVPLGHGRFMHLVVFLRFSRGGFCS